MKCLETRKLEGYTRRRYERQDGTRVTTYEISEPFLFKADIERLVRRAALGRANLIPRDKIRVDPDKIDAVLEALDGTETHQQIAERLHVSTKTIQRIKRGYR